MSMKNWQVLLVEDEIDGQEVVQGMLDIFGVASDPVGTAEAGLECLENRDYTAVIVDLHLPKMDGIDFIEVIRDDPKFMNLPCIAVTAYHSTEVKQQALEAGYDAYLPKPLDDTAFIRELERIIESVY
jgi:CheY-like chemotaxis protein